MESIKPINRSLEPAVRAHLDQLTKPPNSLGRLEDLAVQYCLITNRVRPSLGKKKIFRGNLRYVFLTSFNSSENNFLFRGNLIEE